MPSPGSYSSADVALANRNKGMPLEALRYDVTPVGMHYTLTHFDIPDIDPADHRLVISGLVERPIVLALDDLRAAESQTLVVTLECAGNGRSSLDPRPDNMPWGVEAVGTAAWTGVPLREAMRQAGAKPEVVELVFSGSDEGYQDGVRQRYQRSLRIDECMRPEILLAWAMNGRPLEPQHGAPLRLVVPGWYGMASVKWLHHIDAVDQPFLGPQQSASYNIRQAPDDPGERVTRMLVRALMVPPGRPHFPTLERTVDAGPTPLFGRAWSGSHPIERVEVGIDGRWSDATLGEVAGPYGWRSWSSTWEAKPGVHELACRATDSAGHRQPLEQAWNLDGYGNNAVQRLPVNVV